MKTKKKYRRYEKEYRKELVSIRREFEYLVAFMRECPTHRIFTSVAKDLKRRGLLIKRTLRKPKLPPMTDRMRNPFNIPLTTAEMEFVKSLGKNSKRPAQSVPIQYQWSEKVKPHKRVLR
jgi:hypothetical protein